MASAPVSRQVVARFLRHIALAHQKRGRATAVARHVDMYIRSAKHAIAKGDSPEHARTILDELKDRITGLLVAEKVIAENEERDSRALSMMQDRIASVESAVASTQQQVRGVQHEERGRHRAIEEKVTSLAEKQEANVQEDLVRTKKINEITDALRIIEAQHARLSKRKNVDQKDLARLARIIARHKKILQTLS